MSAKDLIVYYSEPVNLLKNEKNITHHVKKLHYSTPMLPTL